MSQLERDDSLSENLLQILDPILPEIGTKLRHVRSAIAPAATAAKRTACLYIMTEKMYVVVGANGILLDFIQSLCLVQWLHPICELPMQPYSINRKPLKYGMKIGMSFIGLT